MPNNDDDEHHEEAWLKWLQFDFIIWTVADVGLQESRAVAQKPRDAVVIFFIEIYIGIARSSLR